MDQGGGFLPWGVAAWGLLCGIVWEPSPFLTTLAPAAMIYFAGGEPRSSRLRSLMEADGFGKRQAVAGSQGVGGQFNRLTRMCAGKGW